GKKDAFCEKVTAKSGPNGQICPTFLWMEGAKNDNRTVSEISTDLREEEPKTTTLEHDSSWVSTPIPNPYFPAAITGGKVCAFSIP
ncbi:MAG: hypothetical protein JXB07_20995, partial [Anaerolineae bacterium]|nr:hypothetical protein [Anaerolineae bacterium]